MEKPMKTLSFDPLWKTLIDRKMSKTELAEKAKFSRTTLAKMGKNEVISLEVIIRICSELDCQIYDVIEVQDPASP